MFPEYSLMIARRLNLDEIHEINGKDLRYIEENSDGTGYQLFTEDEVSYNNALYCYMNPIEVRSRGMLETRYVVYLEVFKIYDKTFGEALTRKFNSDIFAYGWQVNRGFFHSSDICNPKPIMRDLMAAYEEVKKMEWDPDDCGVVFYTHA